jgi:cGMP-dependent protein kinase
MRICPTYEDATYHSAITASLVGPLLGYIASIYLMDPEPEQVSAVRNGLFWEIRKLLFVASLKSDYGDSNAKKGKATAGAPTLLGAPSSSDSKEFLAKVELLKRLPADELPKLAKAAKQVDFSPNTKIITQGDSGDAFFVIKSGTAKVEIDDKEVAKLKGGDFFGEMALIREDNRAATVTATSAVTCFKITRADFFGLGLMEKLEFPKRGAVNGGVGGDVQVQAPCAKSAEEKELMKQALMTNANLTKIFTIDDDKAKVIIDLMWKIDVAAKEEVIKQGSLDADYFYIVKDGTFEITQSQGPQSATTAAAASVGEIGKGGSFGELALMYFAPRAATITATTAGQLWVIDRNQFKNILSKTSEDLLMTNVKYLEKIGLLKDLKDDEKKELATALSDALFYKDETVFNQGEEGKLLYILVDGEVAIEKDGKLETKLTASKSEPKIFGERALLKQEARSATVRVMSECVKALTIDKTSFDMLIGPLEQIIQRGKDGNAVVKKVQAESTTGEKRFGNILRKDLSTLCLLGCGGFGAVSLVEHKPTGATYAMKALSKGYVVKSGMQASLMSEKKVQLMCDSPFIVKLYETYNGQESLYLLLELALGGELYATYNKKQLWGNEPCAQFYIAGTTYAFEHLHSKKIIFRDLKPENLLLNDKGQVKLTDMGLAKVVVGKTYSTCGTPDYFAPEIIASKGHTHAVDWWTLGILTFELMIGHPPFESATPMQIYQKVSRGINKVVFPKRCPGPVENLVKALCAHNPSERLAMKKGDIGNIKSHQWFKGFNWEEFNELKMKPPYLPSVKNPKDGANFNARKEDIPPQIPYKDPKTGWDKDFATST